MDPTLHDPGTQMQSLKIGTGILKISGGNGRHQTTVQICKSIVSQKQNHHQRRKKTCSIMLRYSSLSFVAIAGFATVLSSPMVVTAQTQYEVNPWKVPGLYDAAYPPTDVKVGDTITFLWNPEEDTTGARTVFINPSGNCWDKSNAQWIGSTSGTKYTFTEADAGKNLFFASDVDSHCEDGMNIVVTIAPLAKAPTWAPTWEPTNKPTEWVAPPTWAPTWEPTNKPTEWVAPPTWAPTWEPTKDPIASPVAPPTAPTTGAPVANAPVPIQQSQTIRIDQWIIQPYEPIDVNVGDKLEIQVGGAHNVYLHPTLNCDEDGRELIGEPNSLATYEFTEADAGKQLLFVCDVGNHCEDGMALLVTVSGGDDAAVVEDDSNVGGGGSNSEEQLLGPGATTPEQNGNGGLNLLTPGGGGTSSGTTTTPESAINDEGPSSASKMSFVVASVLGLAMTVMMV
jgi:plastocyanin